MAVAGVQRHAWQVQDRLGWLDEVERVDLGAVGDDPAQRAALRRADLDRERRLGFGEDPLESCSFTERHLPGRGREELLHAGRTLSASRRRAGATAVTAVAELRNRLGRPSRPSLVD